MTFIVVLVALLIERFFDWSHLRAWSWYHTYLKFIMRYLHQSSPYMMLMGTILPVLLGVSVMTWLLKGWLYGFVELVAQLAILLYCLGPQNLWAYAYGTLTAFKGSDAASTSSSRKQFINSMFIEANRRIFAILFWYVVLGPLGAVLYRSISMTTKDEAYAHHVHSTNTVLATLDWIPARILTFLFALGGHFVQVFVCWRQKIMQGLHGNDSLLSECGQAALGHEKDELVMANHAVGLIDRTFVMALVMIAVMVLLM